jgi:hypothetical protein
MHRKLILLGPVNGKPNVKTHHPKPESQKKTITVMQKPVLYYVEYYQNFLFFIFWVFLWETNHFNKFLPNIALDINLRERKCTQTQMY